jgi:predicted alpha/beta-hydrolase family hydrolase
MLNRSSNANIIHYNEITQPIKVWHGSRDEKITLASVKALETLVSRCEIKVVLGADHSLMTNVPVFTEALRSIAKELL